MSPESLREKNANKINELKTQGKVTLSDLDHSSLDHFALIMFADLKNYIFRSKFVVIRPEYDRPHTEHKDSNSRSSA